jgi:predicted dehydrogenase
MLIESHNLLKTKKEQSAMGISLGLVGLGAFGSSFADLFRSHPLVDRVALCDREPERVEKFAQKKLFQSKFNKRDTYEHFDDILKSDLDALVIITQPWLHAEQAVRALEYGKHVYSAVPLAYVPDANEILGWCDKLVNACQRTGSLYMLGETTFYHPETMYCRRRAAEGAFGKFVYSEGQYIHDVDSVACSLRTVKKNRLASKAGKEWTDRLKTYRDRGVYGGPMHYPTHSVSGPMSVMQAHALKACCWGFEAPKDDDFYDGEPFSNETALFYMSNGSTMRISEHRQVGLYGNEDFNVHGTEGGYDHGNWVTRSGRTPLTVSEMRDPLPPEVAEAFSQGGTIPDFYGGHKGSHAYLVHEFVDAIANRRQPAINAWEAARYMAAGATAHLSALKDGEILKIPDWGDAPKARASAGALSAVAQR